MEETRKTNTEESGKMGEKKESLASDGTGWGGEGEKRDDVT